MNKVLLGTHMSIEGGFYRAVERAAEVGCDCVQLFTAPPRQFGTKAKSKPAEKSTDSSGSGSTDDNTKQKLIAAGQAFQAALTRCQIQFPLSHASYLINLASPDEANRAKGVQTLLDELDRAALLGIPNVVLHPGAYTSGSAATGIRTIIETLDLIFQKSPHTPTRILLENTAGQGTTLGATLDELSQIQKAVQYPERIGICIDTCHAFAAGYDLASIGGYQKFWDEVDQTVGLGQVLAIHLNDSKKECGSRVDRHEHIGKGCIGLEGFRRLLNDAALNSIPMYLETDKGEDDNGEDWDIVNLRTLRSLAE